MSQNILRKYPPIEDLLEWYSLNGSNIIHEVNNHFHTPYSFSSFENLRQVFDLALKDNLKVLGINDFNTASGYEEFNELGLEFKLFPCFNIELSIFFPFSIPFTLNIMWLVAFTQLLFHRCRILPTW